MTGDPHASTPQPEPQWLDHTELGTWMNLAQILMLMPTALDRQLREEAGLPHTHYHILSALSGRPDRAMRMTELARQAGTTTTRLSHAVSALEQRGWVGRRACRTDRRGQIAYLTDAGFTVLAQAAPGHVAEVRRLVFDHLTEDDVRHLHTISGKLLPALNRSGTNPR